jgi:hypothetical protein
LSFLIFIRREEAGGSKDRDKFSDCGFAIPPDGWRVKGGVCDSIYVYAYMLIYLWTAPRIEVLG